jgi:hypothetical protein
MSIFALFKAKNWFDRRIQSALKYKKISIITVLILISGLFFYNQIVSVFPRCFADDFETRGKLMNERMWIGSATAQKTLSTSENQNFGKVITASAQNRLKKEVAAENNIVEKRIDQIVGNAPIKEMVPFIAKLDAQVGAFVVGIAKKESDWGRHAPTQGGKTCYNYWGYKGTGSRGTSMGYACFGTAEEAVATIGKRIDTLVKKNINDPRKFVVWKCGTSCAGHDPQGVQKWISDVSLYYGKVMKIRST